MLNVHFAWKGGVQSNGFKFPYQAKSVVDLKVRDFKDIGDVYNELERAYDKATDEGFPVGESLYAEHFFYANSTDLVDEKAQVFIKEFQYCKDSNTPPFPSLKDTPADFIDKWDIVKNEILHLTRQEKDVNNK